MKLSGHHSDQISGENTRENTRENIMETLARESTKENTRENKRFGQHKVCISPDEVVIATKACEQIFVSLFVCLFVLCNRK